MIPPSRLERQTERIDIFISAERQRGGETGRRRRGVRGWAADVVENGASRKIDGRSAVTHLGAISHLSQRLPNKRPLLLEMESILI